MEDDSTLLSSQRRTRIGLFANCYEKDENMESAKKRAFGLGPGLGSRIPRGIHGVWGRSAGTTRRFIILCFPAWWVLASGFRFCRDDGKNPGWSGGAGTLGLLEKARQLRTRASRLSALVGERRTHPRSSPPDSPQPPAFVACHGARSLCAAACENPAE